MKYLVHISPTGPKPWWWMFWWGRPTEDKWTNVTLPFSLDILGDIMTHEDRVEILSWHFKPWWEVQSYMETHDDIS